jgi:hypothetical protein
LDGARQRALEVPATWRVVAQSLLISRWGSSLIVGIN